MSWSRECRFEAKAAKHYHEGLDGTVCMELHCMQHDAWYRCFEIVAWASMIPNKMQSDVVSRHLLSTTSKLGAPVSTAGSASTIARRVVPPGTDSSAAAGASLKRCVAPRRIVLMPVSSMLLMTPCTESMPVLCCLRIVPCMFRLPVTRTAPRVRYIQS
jgi:hypothetical protein